MDILNNGYFLALVPMIMRNIQAISVYGILYNCSDVTEILVEKTSSIIQVLLDIDRLEKFIENNYFSINNLPGFDIEQSLSSFEEWSHAYFHRFFSLFQKFPW